MDAIVVDDFGSASVEAVPDPSVRDNELLVSVDRVQMSVTECALFQGEEVMGSDIIRKRLEDGEGRFFGHEFCGTVKDIGSDVEQFSSGDRVYAPGKIICGSCPYCAAGVPSLCENYRTLGTHRSGALAELVAAPAEIFRSIPDTISDAEGAALQPLADVTLSVHDVGVTSGDTVAIVGSGIMGFYCGQVMLAEGAGHVLSIDVDPTKVDLAKSQGMTGINATTSDPVDVVKEKTGQRGADIVVEAVGGDQSMATEGSDPLAQAFEMVRPGGTILQTGIISGTISMDPRKFRAKGVRWHNPLIGMVRPSPSMDIGELAVELVALDRVSITEYITHELNGLDSFEAAVDITMNQQGHDALGPAQLVL